jgi:uncharacterized protein
MTLNKIALITGATSGIGAAFAKKLASQKYDLILTGRREEKIRSLAYESESTHGIKVEVIIAELTNDQDINLILDKIRLNENIEILVNNAGFDVRKNFFEGDIDIYEKILKLHTIVPLKLTHAALQHMLPKDKGTIINVSSVGAFYVFPKSATYGATKAFINSFTETLKLELKDTKIKIQTLCPGLTNTDFFISRGEDATSLAKARGWPWSVMTPEEVVERSLKGVEKNQTICIPGALNKLLVAIKTLDRYFR